MWTCEYYKCIIICVSVHISCMLTYTYTHTHTHTCIYHLFINCFYYCRCLMDDSLRKIDKNSTEKLAKFSFASFIEFCGCQSIGFFV